MDIQISWGAYYLIVLFVRFGVGFVVGFLLSEFLDQGAEEGVEEGKCRK